METKPLFLSPEFLSFAEKQFVLLEPENIAKKRDTIALRVSGYGDVVHLISDIVKVCILALGDGDHYSSAHIPQPESNVSGVLSIILDLLPYEEFDLLDNIREAVLNPQPTQDQWDGFTLESISLIPPYQLQST